ncbi:MAG: major capsid protein [Bacteroidales bacterium]|nr:major capsid protein [Bacteroidales bacterium]
MNTYPISFYDLLSRALGGNDAVRLQGFLDDVLAEKYNSLDTPGFRFADEMQLDFTYEQVQKELGINVMAQYTDPDSPPIPTGTEGFSLSTGKVPRMKMVEYWNEDKYRKMLIAEQRFGSGSDRVVDAAVKALFNTTDKLIGAHTNSLTYQRHQIVSTGKFTLTPDNNPYGIAGLTFASHVPSENSQIITTANKKWWTNKSKTTEGSAADPIDDLQKMVKKARKKGVRGHFELNDAYMDAILGHSKVTSALGIYFFPMGDAAVIGSAAAIRPRTEKISALAAIVGANFKTFDHQSAVEKFDNGSLKRETFDAFESDVIVFVPDGNLGEIVTVEPISMGGTAASFYGGRLLLTVDVDYTKKCQTYLTEMTSLVVPTVPQYFWYLYPNNN